MDRSNIMKLFGFSTEVLDIKRKKNLYQATENSNLISVIRFLFASFRNWKTRLIAYTEVPKLTPAKHQMQINFEFDR